jgi:class 3 adenylate cyclase
MSLADDLKNDVEAIFAARWDTRQGHHVPETEQLRLGNDAVLLSATVLYADLASSTALVDSLSAHRAAEIYKAFLACAAKVIRANGGVITAYDGDRIMAVFIGDHKNTNAANTALKINHARSQIVVPAMRAQYPDMSNVDLSHGVGVDTSNLFVARTGVRGANDLVWVGSAANWAAKLSDIREGNYCSFITAAVYDRMNDLAKLSSDGQRMWEARTWQGKSVYRSNWRRRP